MDARDSEAVFIIAPYGRDGEAAERALRERGMDARHFVEVREACAQAREGMAAFVVAEEALTTPQLAILTAFLEDQPAWSDLPVIVLSHTQAADESSPSRALRKFNVALLERPLYIRTLIASVQVAIRARRRQYEVRSLLEQRLSLLDREREARERAETANRVKDEFFAILGHELRNPLAPIVTALQLMRLRKPQGVDRELMILDRQVAHVTNLVDDLLDVSRIAQGKIEVRRDVVVVADIISRAIEMTSPIFEQKGHHLAVHVEPDLYVRGDHTRLAQVLANLLTNAAKYTSPKGTIEISASRDRSNVVVRVRDNGIGIAPQMLERVFVPFAQEKQASDRAPGGLGLGLAIVRSLVELHGGSVEARSDGLERGSEFSFRLPVLERGAVSARTTPHAIVERPNMLSVKILVVDDNEDAADLLALTLTEHGYTTRIAHDAANALHVADQFKPDLAVLDIGLPVMDGYELAQRFKQHPHLQGVRLIALTGYGQPGDLERSRRAGFDEHFVKPVDLQKLENAMHRLLNAQG